MTVCSRIRMVGIWKYTSFRFIENIISLFPMVSKTEDIVSILNFANVMQLLRFEKPISGLYPPDAFCTKNSLLWCPVLGFLTTMAPFHSILSTSSLSAWTYYKSQAAERGLHRWELSEWYTMSGEEDFHHPGLHSEIFPSLPIPPWDASQLQQGGRQGTFKIPSFPLLAGVLRRWLHWRDSLPSLRIRGWWQPRLNWFLKWTCNI